jgi:Flp pilus assembly pilin Flp
MKGIKKFFMDEAGTAEATSTVIMIAAVGVLLASGLILWYTGVNTAFNTAGESIKSMTNGMVTDFSGS